MSKALVIADPHIHAHKDRVDRLHHCLDVLEWAFKTACEHECEYMFFLGDLFHDRAKIDVLIYLRTFETFMRNMLCADHNMQVYLLVGNHDMYHKERWDVNSVKPLTAINNVYIIDKPTQTVLGGRRIDWMPHTDNPIRDLNAMKDLNGGAGNILFGHMAVNGAMLNINYGTKADVIVEYDNDMVPVDPDVFDDWDMTMLGHYHGAQQLTERAEYVGSPLELTYGEAFQQKHVIILDLETMSKQYIVNNFSPKHLIVNPSDVINETYDLNGNFVRLSVDDLGSKEVSDMRWKIAQDYKVLSFDTKQKERKIEDDKTVIEDVRSILRNIHDALRTYIKERGVPEGMDEDKLIKKGELCLEKNTLF